MTHLQELPAVRRCGRVVCRRPDWWGNLDVTHHQDPRSTNSISARAVKETLTMYFPDQGETAHVSP